MKRLLSREGLREKVTLRLTVRALAVSVAIFALVVTFAIVGGYQGIQANRSATQATKNSQVQGRQQRLQAEADLQAQIQDVACTLIAIVPVDKTVPGPFRDKVLAIIKKYDCVTYNKTHHTPPPVLPGKTEPQSGGSSSAPKVSSGPQPKGNGGSSPAFSGSRRPRQHPPAQPTPTPPPPTHAPSPLPTPTPVGPVLSSVCKLLDPVLGTCVIG